MAVKQSGGHHARAAVPKQRRTDIWDHVFNTFQSKIPRGKWCTKEEIVKASGGKHGVIFSVEELAEVMRGKKHKDTLGIDSNKVDGEWQYRYMSGHLAKATEIQTQAGFSYLGYGAFYAIFSIQVTAPEFLTTCRLKILACLSYSLLLVGWVSCATTNINICNIGLS